MGSWHPVKTSGETFKPKEVHGVRFDVLVSPYDVPEAVRGYRDSRLNRFIIEFRYLADESWHKEKLSDELTVRVGRHSHRLYGLEVDVDALKAGAVGLRLGIVVERLFSRLQASNHAAVRSDNYRLARDAMQNRMADLERDLAGVG